jgi:hypothetical protein
LHGHQEADILFVKYDGHVSGQPWMIHDLFSDERTDQYVRIIRESGQDALMWEWFQGTGTSNLDYDWGLFH